LVAYQFERDGDLLAVAEPKADDDVERASLMRRLLRNSTHKGLKIHDLLQPLAWGDE
jgi:hypothetical protein